MKKIALFFLVTLCFLVYSYEVKSADDIKPQYNIVIWNLTDAPTKNIVVTYGAETFRISRMESFTFKNEKLCKLQRSGNCDFSMERY